MVIRKLFIVPLVALLIACGAASKSGKSVNHHANPSIAYTPLSKNASQRFKYFYLEAINQQNKGNYAGAFDLLNHCQEINPNAAEVYFMRSAYYSSMKDDSLMRADIERAAALNPNNTTYLERLGQAYIAWGNFPQAIETYETIFANTRDRDDVLNILIQLYDRQKDYDNMLRSIDRLESLEGSSEEITLARMRVLSMKGDKEAELAELKSLSAKHPNDMNYHVMMGNWLLQNDRANEALNEYQYVLGMEPENLMARMSMLDYYRNVGEDSLATDLQEKMLISETTPVNSKMTLMRKVVADNEQQGGDSTEVLDLFRRILARPQKTTDMHELYAAYMTLKKMPKDSICQALSDALAIAPDNAGVRLELIQSKWGDKEFDEVIRLCKAAQEYNPDEMAFYYFMGLAHFQKNEKDEALQSFQLGVSQINESSNKEIVSDFYAIMGDILHEKNREAEAYAAYDSCLQWKPDNVGCLNNYAYYLSEKGKDLQKVRNRRFILTRPCRKIPL